MTLVNGHQAGDLVTFGSLGQRGGRALVVLGVCIGLEVTAASQVQMVEEGWWGRGERGEGRGYGGGWRWRWKWRGGGVEGRGGEGVEGRLEGGGVVVISIVSSRGT